MRPPPAFPGGPCETTHDRPAPPPGAPGRVDGTLPGRPHPADRAPRARPRRRRHPRPRAPHRGGGAAGVGLGQVPPFTTYHRVLNRNRWSGRAAAERLLHLLVAAFAPDGPVVV